jgi:uncharacterized membrane-anchored protein
MTTANAVEFHYDERDQRDESGDILRKVPHVTLAFWIVKILATTLGETGGDALSVVVATTTVGTTTSDYIDRTLGVGYVKSSAILLVLLIAVTSLRNGGKPGDPVTHP